LGRLVNVRLRQRSFAVRLPRRRRKAAWALAIAGPAVITVGSRELRSSVPPASVLFATLLLVVAAALLGGARPALTAVAVGLLAQEILYTFPYGSLTDHKPAQLSVLVEFVVVGVVVGILVDALNRLTEEQAALRRVATLVARAAPSDELFAAVTEEVGRLLPVEMASMTRYDSDDRMTVLATWGGAGDRFSAGARLDLGGTNLSTVVARSGRPVRIDGDTNTIDAQFREVGIRSAVATPIVVDGRPWGMMIAGSIVEQPLPADTEGRLADFTDLVATAIGNAATRAELAASRARIVVAADETRRRIERDLHDGAQQWLVSLALELRAVQALVPPKLGELQGELSGVADGLAGVLQELREMARGIHPAILAEGGLGPALKTLARRSPVPVELDVRAGRRLPERVEVATYFVVSEALTNAAKHAHASVIHVEVEAVEQAVLARVRDDGVGGADRRRGSGLIGLADRVEALGGTLTVRSPLGAGTSLEVELPLDD
jgi:signal transduction histidine kinase